MDLYNRCHGAGAMVLTRPDSHGALGVARELAGMVQEISAARRLWVRGHRDDIQLWILTEATDAATERRLYEAGAVVQLKHPDVHIVVDVINPRLYDREDPSEVVPSDAKEIDLS